MTRRDQRRAEERERQQTEVLDVALGAFARSGYSGASMKDIATASGAINEIIDTSLGFFDHHRDFFEIYLRHTAGMRANVERVFSPPLVELNRKMNNRVKRVFRQASEQGLTAGLSPSDMTTALSELTSGFIAAWATAGYPGRVSRKSKVIKHLLWNGIRA